MNCAQVRDALPDYTVEILDARAHRAVEAHLAACAECREELRVLNSVVALVEEHGVRQPPPGLFNAVRNQIVAGEARQVSPPWWAWIYSRPARGLAMGMAMAAVAVGLFFPVSGPQPLPSVGLHPTTLAGGQVASGELAGSIRQHAMSSSGGGLLADRVAWEAMAQLVTREEEKGRRSTGATTRND